MKYDFVKIGAQEYRGDRQIEAILSKKNIYWLNDCEFEKAQIEINRGKVTWKDGTWYNGVWKGECWENGEWFYGTWTGGLWKGGTFHDGKWLDGVFDNGNFINGDVRGGVFKNHDVPQENNP